MTRWRTAHKRVRRKPRLTTAPYRTWDYYKRRFAWYAMKERLAAGPLYPANVDQLRDDLRAPQFRRYLSHPAIIIEPKQPQHFPDGTVRFVGMDLGR